MPTTVNLFSDLHYAYVWVAMSNDGRRIRENISGSKVQSGKGGRKHSSISGFSTLLSSVTGLSVAILCAKG